MQQDQEVADLSKQTDEVLELTPSTSRGNAERNGTPTKHKRSYRPTPKATSSAYLQPGRALDLFCDPSKEMLWDEKPLWTPVKMFPSDGDDTTKSLLLDMRASLTTSKSSAYAPQLLPSTQPLNSCLSQMPTVQKVAFNDSEMKTSSGRKSLKSKTTAGITLLKRPTMDVKNKLELGDNKISAQNIDDEALMKLERFCKDGKIKVFESALKLCTKSLRQTYYAMLDLATHPEGKDVDIKNGLLTNFANSLERAYLKEEKLNSNKLKINDESKTLDDSTVEKPRITILSSKGFADKDELLKQLFDVPTKNSTVSKIELKEEENSRYYAAYKMLLAQARKHHSAFIVKLSELLGGYDPNLILKRDLSGNYSNLITVHEFKRLLGDNSNKFNAIRPFLYREYMNMAILERIALKTFKIDNIALRNPLDMASIYFTKAAICNLSKTSPFDGLSSVCVDRSYLTRHLYALCAFIRDSSNHRAISVELQNLSKLYVKFFTTFTLIYDAIFNHNYRRGNPFRRMKNQRWLFPDGVKDLLYDPDPAKRICNHLSRFVDENLLQLFKYYHYWAGIRLLMFIGYKIIDRLDMDQFDEQVQVALYGLSVGLSAKIGDSTHLLQLAKFLIAVVTVCEQQKDLDTEQRAYRTACRLLVEYFALLLKTFNSLFSTSTLHETLKSQLFNDEMMAFLLPITILTHWMANSPQFFEHEAWNRKWSMNLVFTADFWPELSTLANSLRLLKNNGVFNSISLSNRCEYAGQVIPEIANLFGISPIFNEFPSRFNFDSGKLKITKVEALVRLFSVWENVQSIALNANKQCFVYQEKKGFEGFSDESRFLISEPDYFETPQLMPVPLDEIEDCINNRKKELESEQGLELANLIELAKSEAKNEQSILHDKILIIVRPRHLVIDTNSFIDGLDTILSLLEDPYFTILVPLPVISELKGLRNKKSASPSAQDEDHAKQVSKAAVRSLQVLDTIKKDNIKLLLRKGRVLNKMDINYQDISYEAKVNNDRLIIETAKEYSEKICPKSIRTPRGDLWLFRDVLLVTKDRIMMLLANAYRLPSLDITAFNKWAGF